MNRLQIRLDQSYFSAFLANSMTIDRPNLSSFGQVFVVTPYHRTGSLA
jgi:hypothetical protein